MYITLLLLEKSFIWCLAFLSWVNLLLWVVNVRQLRKSGVPGGNRTQAWRPARLVSNLPLTSTNNFILVPSSPLYHILLHHSLHPSWLPFIFYLPPRHSCCSFNGAVQWEQKGVKIVINRSIMMCSLAVKYPLPCPKEPSREERKLFQLL